MEKVLIRVSAKGVPHTIYFYKGRQFSVCYFGKRGFYRIFDWETSGFDQKKIEDVPVAKGDVVDLLKIFDKYINNDSNN